VEKVTANKIGVPPSPGPAEIPWSSGASDSGDIKIVEKKMLTYFYFIKREVLYD
jgi:hypothetical protein